MDLNSIIFPAPQSSFEFRKIDDIIWIPKREAKKIPNSFELSATNNTGLDENEKVSEMPKATKSEPSIPCLYLPYKYGSDKVLIYFHGNAEDIGWALEFCNALKAHLQVHVLAMEYPGYSMYVGEPDADKICRDAEIVFDFLTMEIGIAPNNVFLFGRSIGSGPATFLASRRDPGALLLMSPIASVRAVAKEVAGKLANLMVAERFKNIDEIKNVRCPSYFIHGKADTLVPFKQTVDLMNECQGISDMHLPENMTHNDFNLREDVIEPILKFLTKCGIKIENDKPTLQYDFPKELYEKPAHVHHKKNKRSMLSKFYDKFIG